jgi:hypothetical protein
MYAERISRVLYYHDLADTSCKENKAYDEYDLFARYVLSAVEEDGVSLKDAIEFNLEYFFALEPDEIDEERVNSVVDEIEKTA